MKEARPVPHPRHLPAAAAVALHWSRSLTRHLERPRLVPARSRREAATRSRRRSPKACAIMHLPPPTCTTPRWAPALPATALRSLLAHRARELSAGRRSCPFQHPSMTPAWESTGSDLRVGLERPWAPYLRTERCWATVVRGAGGHRVAAVGLRCERGAGRGRRRLTSARSSQVFMMCAGAARPHRAGTLTSRTTRCRRRRRRMAAGERRDPDALLPRRRRPRVRQDRPLASRHRRRYHSQAARRIRSAASKPRAVQR